MSKKYRFIIIVLTAASICFGIISIYFYTRIQHNRNQNFLLEEKVREYEKQLYEDYKKRISELIKKDISIIVSEEPSYGGKWYVTKILFINPSLVSVEYEDGHFIHESQIRIIRPKENFRFENYLSISRR